MRRDLLAKVRRRQLERDAGRFPLMAEGIIAAELERRPRYYEGEDEDPGINSGASQEEKRPAG
jgi:hypothetical protein